MSDRQDDPKDPKGGAPDDPKGGAPDEAARMRDRRKNLLRRAFRNIPGAEVMSRRGGSGAAPDRTGAENAAEEETRSRPASQRDAEASPGASSSARASATGSTTPSAAPSTRSASQPRSPSATAGAAGTADASATAGTADASATAAEGRRLRSEITSLGAVIDKQDYYKRLGVARDASQSRIKAAHLALVKRFHPDRAGLLGLDAESRRKLGSIFSAIQEAWEVLGHAERRAAYDRDLGASQSHPDRDEKRRRTEAQLKFKKGEILFKKKDYAGALPLLEAAFKAEPENGDYRVTYAWVLHAARPADEVDREVKNLLVQAVKANARADLAHYYLGILARMEGSTDRAEKHFREALEKNAKLEAAATELRVLQRKKEKETGGSLLKRMLKKD